MLKATMIFSATLFAGAAFGSVLTCVGKHHTFQAAISLDASGKVALQGFTDQGPANGSTTVNTYSNGACELDLPNDRETFRTIVAHLRCSNPDGTLMNDEPTTGQAGNVIHGEPVYCAAQ